MGFLCAGDLGLMVAERMPGLPTVTTVMAGFRLTLGFGVEFGELFFALCLPAGCDGAVELLAAVDLVAAVGFALRASRLVTQ